MTKLFKYFISFLRPKIKQVSSDEFGHYYVTQAQKGSAKISLGIPQNVVHKMNSWNNYNFAHWNQLENFAIQVSELGLAFCANTFFFRIAENAIQKLTSAGIMYWLFDDEIKDSSKFQAQKNPKKLTIESLSFGFEIWFGFCGLSVAAFVGEILLVKLKKLFPKTTKISKVTDRTGCLKNVEVKRKRKRRKLFKKKIIDRRSQNH